MADDCRGMVEEICGGRASNEQSDAVLSQLLGSEVLLRVLCIELEERRS